MDDVILISICTVNIDGVYGYTRYSLRNLCGVI